MHQLKTKTVKKLFYKKWLYKIVLECGGLSYLHRRGIDYVASVIPTSQNPWIRGHESTVAKNRTQLIKIGVELEKLLANEEHQLRVESGTCGIFTNSEDLVEEVTKTLPEFVTEIHKPADNDQANFLLTNKNKILCDEFPLDGYQFKIYFKNGEIKDKALMENFLHWANNYDGRIHIPNGTKKILSSGAPYFYGQYFYAKDKKLASMALMLMGSHLNKTEEYVLKSDVI